MAVAAALAVAGAAPARAATILQKLVDVEIRADGSVAERTHLEVRLDAAAELAAWSPFPIGYDDHATLGALSAWVRRPDGTTEKVGRQGFDTVDVAGEEILHSSAKVRLVRFPAAPAGAVLGLDYERTERPYFPAGSVALGGNGAAISRLSVHVHGGGPGWRWSILGSTAGLHVSEPPGELSITAASLARPAEIQHAPDEVRDGPVLRYAWGAPATWGAVGRWYDELARDVPRDREEVRRTAGRITAAPAAVIAPGPSSRAAVAAPAPQGRDDQAGEAARRRRQLESILAFVRREVRYVAVEVGVGGYRPAPPHETLARRWGDCKAKVLLLLDLLKEAGFEAYPALLRAAPEGRIDPEFPVPGWFNHMIAALPAAGLAVTAEDPVAGGYLFVDPTQERGGAGWLHPADQDQLALVLRAGESALVRTPLRPRLEELRLTLDLAVRPDGGAAGELRLELRGGAAAALADRLAAERPASADAEARRLIGAWLPGSVVSAPRWLPDRDPDVPAVTLTAKVDLPTMVAVGQAAAPQPEGGSAPGELPPIRSLALGGPRATPAPGLLRDRSAPVVQFPRIEEITWRLGLPAGWCPPQSERSGVENAAGAFHQSLSCAGGSLTVERRTELRQRWVNPDQLPDLAALALAEHRAAARRIRLDRLHG